MSFKFAKLPDEIESEAGRDENDKLFAVPGTDPAKDLKWSKLFMLGNPSFFIFEIEDQLQIRIPRNLFTNLCLYLSLNLEHRSSLSSGFSGCVWNRLGAKVMRIYNDRGFVHVYHHTRELNLEAAIACEWRGATGPAWKWPIRSR